MQWELQQKPTILAHYVLTRAGVAAAGCCSMPKHSNIEKGNKQKKGKFKEKQMPRGAIAN